MKRTSWCAFILVAVCSTFAQVEHGTVGVTFFTDQKIIMAADSRMINEGTTPLLTNYRYPRSLPRDDVCKIVALHKQLLFVSAGYATASGRSALVSDWSVYEEIKIAYTKVVAIYGTPQGHVEEIANACATGMADHFENIVIWGGPENLPDFNGRLIKALIGGKDEAGNLVMFLVTIVSDPSNILRAHVIPPEKVHAGPVAIGEPEVVDEFFPFPKTSRAISETTRLRLLTEAEQAERLVELTILWGATYVRGAGFFNTFLRDVHGPVDSVELDKNGLFQWWHRKPNCPEDYAED